MTIDFTVTSTVNASPKAVFDAWMSTDGHAHMTGSPAVVDPRPGGLFVAWDGYINGKTISTEPRKIVQSWRSADFDPDDPDSVIEVRLARHAGGTKITIRHKGVPQAGQEYRDGGWDESYFEPMRKYFGG